MLAEPAHAQRDDGREADGLEEERNVQHAHARVPALGDGGRDEDDAHAQVEQKDPSRPNKLHQADAREAAECEGALSPGEELGPERRVRPRSRLGHVVDEVSRDSDLGARVAELGKGRVEQAVLFPEGLLVGISVRLLGLEGHVRVGDFGDRAEVEDGGEQEAETCDGEVDPLHVRQRLGVVAGLEEEDVGA